MKTFLKIVLGLLILAAVAGVAAHLLTPGGILHRIGIGSPPEQWTCPMIEHADVRAAGPGPCPKCGMDLVPLSKAFHQGKAPSAAGAAAEGDSVYYCPMHPDYTSDRPGDCPICNMKLEILKDDAATPSPSIEGRALVTVVPEQQQRIGVTFAAVVKRRIDRTIRAVGRVEYDEKTLAAVSLKVGGWAEELHVKAAGDRVTKGEPILALYSPDLLEAQRTYLLAYTARAARKDAAPLASLEEALASARERLILWDVAESQIRELEKSGQVKTRFPILAKRDGVAIERSVVEGSYAEAGKTLFTIADLSTVWVLADLYEDETPLIAVGAKAAIELSSRPGEPIASTVAYIYPYLKQGTRTVRVRLEVPNPGGDLKPGMYATVSLAQDLGERIVVDEEAVLDTGTRPLVFVDRGEGRFEPRRVTLGVRVDDGLVVVLNGLVADEKVVRSGAFLIDAESKLRSARMARLEGGGHIH